MKHPGHKYGGFVPAISERGMTHQQPTTDVRPHNPLLTALLIEPKSNPHGNDHLAPPQLPCAKLDAWPSKTDDGHL
jgi:hypothetical protein